MQDQLFDTGDPVRHRSKRRRNRERERSRENLVARLVGAGGIRIDPLTGLRYDVSKGGRYLRRAYKRTCHDCGEDWWASDRIYRKTDGACGNCRSKKARAANVAPDGHRRFERPSGYMLVKRGGAWQLEHRAVMEQHLHRPLRQDETVHHINGDRTDNRPENLQLRQGNHGPGQVRRCLDCGSSNITFDPL